MNNENYKNRVGGLLIPLFALRGGNDIGCGNIGALREFIEWSAASGFKLVQLLPINETGADNSPYNAISSVALEPTTVDLFACKDISAAEIEAIGVKYGLSKLRQGDVQWAELKSLNRVLLTAAFAHFCAAKGKVHEKRKESFDAFLKAEASWLNGYALFRVLMERHHSEQWDR